MYARPVLYFVFGALLLLPTTAVVDPARATESDGERWSVEAAVESDIQFRRSLGFRADQEFVRALYAKPDASDADHVMGALLTSSEQKELATRMALEEDAARIEAWFGSSPEREHAFGGVLIDHSAGGKLAVFLTPKSAGVGNDWQAVVKHADRLQIRPAVHSLLELQRIQHGIREAFLADEPSLAGWVETSLDVERNAVVVAFDEDSLGGRAVPLGFVSTFGTTGIVVTTAGWSHATVNLANDPNAPPVYGGHSWKIASDNGPYCSLGFNVSRSGFSGEWMLTAGHCIDQIAFGTNMYHASRLIGTRHDWDYSGPQDFGLIRTSSTSTAGPNVWYLNLSSSSHTLRAVAGANTNYTVGAVRCFTGWRSSWTECGPITKSSADTRYCSGCPALVDLVKYDVSPLVGDSGGAVFRYLDGYVYAAGIQSGSNGTGTRGYFAKWSNLPSSWGIVLIHSQPPCSPCPQ
jgi:hypothetical protein